MRNSTLWKKKLFIYVVFYKKVSLKNAEKLKKILINLPASNIQASRKISA